MSTLSLARVDLSSLSPALRVKAADSAAIALSRLGGVRHVALQTCERFEVYTSDRTDVRAILLQSGFAAVQCVGGREAFRHLVRVATGLASRIPGEPHVLGQVRSALNLAMTSGTASPELTRAFAAAIRCARHVRQRSALGRGEGGYASRAVAAVSSAFGGLSDVHALVVGSGSTAREVAQGFAAASVARLTVAGRHFPSVDAIARETSAQGIELSAVLDARVRCNAVVAAVSSRRPLLTTDTLRAIGARCVVDLGAVPNVEIDTDTFEVSIVRLEDLGDTPHRAAYEVAERLVEREVSGYVAKEPRTLLRCELSRIAS